MSLQIYRPLVIGVLEALEQIFFESKYTDRTLEILFKKNKKWGARDRRFVAEITYDVVRNWRRLLVASGIPWRDEFLGSAFTGAVDLGERGAGQYAFPLTRQDLQKVLTLYCLIKKFEIPDWMKSWLPKNSHPLATWNSPADKATELSVSDWLYEEGYRQLHESWVPTLEALNQPASAFLRVNSLKCSRAQLISSLQEEGFQVEVVKQVDSAVRLIERGNVFRTQAFKDGWFEMQDGASQQVAPLLNVEPGQRVVDACAGSGGKSLHIAALMGNRGKIIAMDVHSWKLGELKKRARRAGVDSIETRAITGTKGIKRLSQSADRLLLDVPCTGVGVLRRKPDTKWKTSPVELPRLGFLQREILSSYSEMVRPGGLLVYATCSVFPGENNEVVDEFVKAKGGLWKKGQEIFSFPQDHGFDGFYACQLIRG